MWEVHLSFSVFDDDNGFMKTKLLLLASLFALTLTSQQALAMGRGKPAPDQPKPPASVPYKEGDVIFIQSQTSQAAALREATESVWTHVGLMIKKGSSWYVVEAVGPVKETPLAEFIGRSKNKSYRVYRFKHFDAATMTAQLKARIPKYNKPYDIYFEWTQERIYCSELTYHLMKDVTGFDLGRIQKMKEMKLDGPYAQALIKKRLTPVSQLEDDELTLIEAK
jgi:hypothetical protein